jgi:hypothetical protein
VHQSLHFESASNVPIATEIQQQTYEGSSHISKQKPRMSCTIQSLLLLQFFQAITEHAIASLTERGGGLVAWAPDASWVSSGSPSTGDSLGPPSIASLSCTDWSAHFNAKPLALTMCGFPIAVCTVADSIAKTHNHNKKPERG